MAFEGDGYAIEVFRSLVTLGIVRRDRLDRPRRTRDRSARLTQRAGDYVAVTPLADGYGAPMATACIATIVHQCLPLFCHPAAYYLVHNIPYTVGTKE